MDNEIFISDNNYRDYGLVKVRMYHESTEFNQIHCRMDQVQYKTKGIQVSRYTLVNDFLVNTRTAKCLDLSGFGKTSFSRFLIYSILESTYVCFFRHDGTMFPTNINYKTRFKVIKQLYQTMFKRKSRYVPIGLQYLIGSMTDESYRRFCSSCADWLEKEMSFDLSNLSINNDLLPNNGIEPLVQAGADPDLSLDDNGYNNQSIQIDQDVSLFREQVYKNKLEWTTMTKEHWRHWPLWLIEKYDEIIHQRFKNQLSRNFDDRIDDLFEPSILVTRYLQSVHDGEFDLNREVFRENNPALFRSYRSIRDLMSSLFSDGDQLSEYSNSEIGLLRRMGYESDYTSQGLSDWIGSE